MELQPATTQLSPVSDGFPSCCYRPKVDNKTSACTRKPGWRNLAQMNNSSFSNPLGVFVGWVDGLVCALREKKQRYVFAKLQIWDTNGIYPVVHAYLDAPHSHTSIQETTSDSDINSWERQHQNENFNVQLFPIKTSMVSTGVLQVKWFFFPFKSLFLGFLLLNSLHSHKRCRNIYSIKNLNHSLVRIFPGSE